MPLTPNEHMSAIVAQELCDSAYEIERIENFIKQLETVVPTELFIRADFPAGGPDVIRQMDHHAFNIEKFLPFLLEMLKKRLAAEEIKFREIEQSLTTVID